jgi:hypothetical protein
MHRCWVEAGLAAPGRLFCCLCSSAVLFYDGLLQAHDGVGGFECVSGRIQMRNVCRLCLPVAWLV